MDEMVINEDEGGGLGGLQARDITRESAQWRAAVYARLGSTSKTTTEIQIHQVQEFAEMKRKIRRLEEQIRSLAYAPARNSTPTTTRGTEIRAGCPDQGQDTRPATLSQKPKLLAILWDEYINGVGGRLPAKQFSRQQRGTCKAVYSQRKVFWDCMERQIDSGATVQTALNRINGIYKGTITQILDTLRTDERKGGHNQLCPFSVDRCRRRRRQ